MKKQLIALIIVLSLLIIGFSGCLEEKNNNPNSQLKEEVIVTTDKTQYAQGESITITVDSNVGEICYMDYGGDACWRLPFGVEHFLEDENKWENVSVGLYTECDEEDGYVIIKCSTTPISFSWDQLDISNLENVIPGKYRIKFYEILGNEGKEIGLWNIDEINSIQLTVYSNEFTIEKRPDEIILNEDYYESSPNDSNTISNVELIDNILNITTSYSGGCEDHEFELVGINIFMESDPVQTDIRLSHNANNDTCEAYITEELTFNLSPLKEAWQETHQQESGTIIINLEGVDEPISYEF